MTAGPVTLGEIEEYLRVVRAGRVSASQALRVRMATKIDEIDARIEGLRRMRGELARIVGCACQSLDHCTCGAAYLARRGREPSARPSPLHVTNGESAGNTLRRTSLGGAVLPWQDVLHEGLVPPGRPAAERSSCLRRAVAQADISRRAGTRPQRRSRAATRRRPLGRRDAYHHRRCVALGPSRASAHGAGLR
jgi:hypothetical protein